MENHNKTIIFCQACVDVCYTLQIIKERGESNCIIFVIHVENLYAFFTSLKLSVIDIIFIPMPYLSLKKPYKTKNEINNIWKTFFQKFEDCIIYFFSLSYDYLTASMVTRLSSKKTNDVYYYCYCEDFLNNPQKTFSVKMRLYGLLYKYITGVHFVTNVKLGFPNFNISKYNIKKIEISDKPETESRFLYKMEQNTDKTKGNVLFFISTDEEDLLTEKSIKKLEDILLCIREKGFTLALKGHPRIGEPANLLHNFDKIIPSYIPSEFMDYSTFKYIIGFGSTALCFPAQHKYTTVISLLDIVEFSDKELQQRLKELIISFSDNTILFKFPEFSI